MGVGGVTTHRLTLFLLVCSLSVFKCTGIPTLRPSSTEDANQSGTSYYSIYILRHEGSEQPCMVAKMAAHARVSYLDIENEERSVYVDLPKNATVKGSCVEPRRMEISWLDENGSQTSLKLSYDEKAPLRQKTEDSYDVGGIIIEKVEYKTLINERTFPGTLKSGEPITATSANLDLFQKSNKCGNHTVDLDSTIGRISLSLMDVQFKEDISEFSDDEKCEKAGGIDTVAIAVGCFLAAIILSAIVSYAFGQWWRHRNNQRNQN